MEIRVCAACWMCGVLLTASADVDVQVSSDNGAAFERLGGVNGVDDLHVALFITQAIAGGAECAGGNTQ